MATSAGGVAPEPQPAGGLAEAASPRRPHLVVVTTRAGGGTAGKHAALIARFWHPAERAWRENTFESLEHALRLFVDESGWTLRQQQQLDRPHSHELVFEASRADFSRPSTEDILRDVGLTPERVADVLDGVDRPDRGR